MNFQTIVHDGFFNNPDKVREWGLTLDYQHPDGTYPGVRTRCTKFIHKKFYEAPASKLISFILWIVVSISITSSGASFDISFNITSDFVSCSCKSFICCL